MNITDYLSQQLGTTPTRDLASAGPQSLALLNAIGNEGTTRAVIASAFWHAALHALKRWQNRPRATYRWNGHALQRFPKDGIDTYVASQGKHPGDGRHDLLIFDPKVTHDEVMNVKLRNSDLVVGWDAAPPSSTAPIATLGRDIIVEANELESFRILVTPALNLEAGNPTAMLATAHVPSPASRSSNSTNGTIGVLTTNSLGQSVVTIAGHTVTAAATTANVGNGSGEIVGRDVLSDSCIVKVTPSQVAALRGKQVRGPRKNAPYNYMPVEFDGDVSGAVKTHIVSASQEIGLSIPGVQLRVLTNPVTNPGDSGAALLSTDASSVGDVVGFSLARTGYGSAVEVSVWIWADSVFTAHGLS